MDRVRSLERENARLLQLAQHDYLTGLYNRGATQEKVEQLLRQTGDGALLVLDVDGFKQVNDQYGHLAGDRLLQQIGQVLGLLFLVEEPVVGRIGGDEFVLYFPGKKGPDFVPSAVRRVRDRLAAVPIQPDSGVYLSVSVAGSAAQPGDDYLTLFDRADQQLLRRKRRRSPPSGPLVPVQGLDADIHKVRQDLREQKRLPGAYCQDYQTFQSIYRFVERGLQRTHRHCCILLITLTDGQGDLAPLPRRQREMDLLQETVSLSLRAGDVFTRYSSCQFLIMAIGASSEDAGHIAARIQKEFYQKVPASSDTKLQHAVCSLVDIGEPARS
ncbi:Probable diguanylate cyclase YfiN [Anaerotruncus sp. 2789STDY5834896]|uniref:Probable diguanylate cyclase YfiN n=1 Tax=uncultured Anaerotruncus sp. TaxID=905011 RepID=A0A1C6FSS5_9FIRM|nr:Probable diguanylate cyclase YfiN [uncultured Anaerotruncus sp.]